MNFPQYIKFVELPLYWGILGGSGLLELTTLHQTSSSEIIGAHCFPQNLKVGSLPQSRPAKAFQAHIEHWHDKHKPINNLNINGFHWRPDAHPHELLPRARA